MIFMVEMINHKMKCWRKNIDMTLLTIFCSAPASKSIILNIIVSHEYVKTNPTYVFNHKWQNIFLPGASCIFLLELEIKL